MAGLLAGLDALLVALALLIAMLVTAQVLRPLLVAVLGQAPLIGGWLAGNVDSGLARFQASIKGPAEASLYLLTSLLEWLDTQARGLLGGLTGLGNETYASIWRLATLSLPAALTAAEQRAEALFGVARSEAQVLARTAEADAAALFRQAEQDAAGLVGQAEAELRTEVAAAEDLAAAEVRRLEQTAGRLFQQAEYDAAQVAARVEQTAEGLVDAARADLSGAIGAVEHDLQVVARAERVALEDSVSILGGDLAAAEARAKTALNELDAATRKSIEGILASTPWAVLAARVGVSEAMLQADVQTLVGLGAVEIRKLMGDAESIRARYGPQVRTALAGLRKT